MSADPAATARFLGAFFDELVRWGVHDVVVSPGSRSTPLTMVAYELSQRTPERLRLFVDVDERGAAFFALGIAKASGRPTAVICTSGTAVANYYPAVLEAESSRVPLIVLTGDRPPCLQGLGAPQTCDQLKAYGDHVRTFRQMPLPAGDATAVAFARQTAREACIAAGGAFASGAEGARLTGACTGGPVHLNFPFDEPLKPDLSVSDLFDAARRCDDVAELAGWVRPQAGLGEAAARLRGLLAGRKTLVLAGEGSCAAEDEACAVLAWARAFSLPLLADPLSGLRCFDDVQVIDNYDNFCASASAELVPDVIVRFGRFPISKKATQFAASSQAFNVVVDPLETRDFNVQTDVFVACEPVDFARSMTDDHDAAASTADGESIQHVFAAAWIAANDAAHKNIVAVEGAEVDFEGSFVSRVVQLVPEGSCLFAANSMSIRALDTFYLKSDKRVTVLCNRGLNGIDGTVSTALGAAQSFVQTTLLTGDLTLLHDLNAFALQRELRVQRERGGLAPSIVVVLLNNNGGAIFDMLPQQSTDPYFERLFLTPQDVDFEAAAATFNVPYCLAGTVSEFEQAYRAALSEPGISLIEVRVPLSGLRDRYAPYWLTSVPEAPRT